MLLHRHLADQGEAEVRLTDEEQREVIARAARLQQKAQEGVTPEQVEATAQELGIQPVYVRRALAQMQQEKLAATYAAEAREVGFSWRRCFRLLVPLAFLLLLARATGHPGLFFIGTPVTLFVASRFSSKQQRARPRRSRRAVPPPGYPALLVPPKSDPPPG